MTTNYTGTFNLRDYSLYSDVFKATDRPGCKGALGPIIALYAITNSKNGRTYIGSTENFRSRWGKHLCELKGGYHGCVEMQADYKRHPDAFTITVLKTFDGTDGLMAAEEGIGYAYNEDDLYNARIGMKPLKGRYGINADGPRPKRRNVRVQCKPRWYDGQRRVGV